MATVQAIVMTGRNIDHFLFDDDLPGHHLGFLGTAGCNGGSGGTAQGASDNRAIAAADGRTHGGSGAAAQGAPDDGIRIDSEDRRGEGGQGDE